MLSQTVFLFDPGLRWLNTFNKVEMNTWFLNEHADLLGKTLHSVDYNDADYNGLVGKRVVVVGIGNSAVDVAVNAVTQGK